MYSLIDMHVHLRTESLYMEGWLFVYEHTFTLTNKNRCWCTLTESHIHGNKELPSEVHHNKDYIYIYIYIYIQDIASGVIIPSFILSWRYTIYRMTLRQTNKKYKITSNKPIWIQGPITDDPKTGSHQHRSEFSV